jgi:MoxR-like ATPase
MFNTPADVMDALTRQNYIASMKIATVLYMAEKLGKPVLAEGPAGVGKTELAKVWAAATGRPLIRLQCYEGLDETKALYEWEYAKQMLYTQLLRDKLSDLLAGTTTLAQAADKLAGEEDVFFSRRFLLPRPLLQAILSETPATLLIDEIDRADVEFEAFLLEILSDLQVSVPELGTLVARHPPLVVLTSNNTRELSEALKRRCVYLYLDYPSLEAELRVVRLKVPDLAAHRHLRQEQQRDDKEVLDDALLALGGYPRQHLRVDVFGLAFPAQVVEAAKGKQHSSRAAQQRDQAQRAPQDRIAVGVLPAVGS